MRIASFLRITRYSYVLSIGLQLVFLLFIALNTALFQIYTVRGNSMLPTFSSGQHLFVNRLSYLTTSPKDGDLIVFTYGTPNVTVLIKRVTGTPGETVLDNKPAIMLASDQFFVRGDNPPQSTDSRTFGPISKQAIVGKVVCQNGIVQCLISLPLSIINH